jgi:hypothetical protein
VCVDVASVAERAAVRGPAAAEVGVRMVADTSGAVEAELGSGSLEQVLDNLISNALDASPHGETVTLGVGRELSRIDVVVEDRGPGMTEEQRRRAFERFASRRRLRRDRTGAGDRAATRRGASGSRFRPRPDPGRRRWPIESRHMRDDPVPPQPGPPTRQEPQATTKIGGGGPDGRADSSPRGGSDLRRCASGER